MAFIKTLLAFAAFVALSFADNNVRTKKDILLGLGSGYALATHDDGSWFPGKYDPTFIPSAIPASLPLSPYSGYSGYSAYSAYPSAYPAMLPYAYSGLYRSPLIL